MTIVYHLRARHHALGLQADIEVAREQEDQSLRDEKERDFKKMCSFS